MSQLLSQSLSRARRSATALVSHGRRRFRHYTDPHSLAGQVVRNSGWLISERLMRMGLAFLVSIWVIRYLGDEQYGILSYAISITTIADVIAQMGMRSIVVRELVEDPEHESEIIGTTVGLKTLNASIAAALIIGVSWIVAPDSNTFPILVVLALSLPLGALGALDLTFQAYLQSQYAVAARIGGLAFATGLRIVLLIIGAPLMAFAIATAVELAAIGIAFMVIYTRTRRSLFSLRFNWRRGIHLASVSWPFLMSAMAASVYLKIDQVMLHSFTTSSQVGQYAAAARLSEIWYFIPVAMASSLLPMLVVRLREDPRRYESNLQRAYDINAWMAIALSFSISTMATPIVAILIGDGYPDTDDILRIHTWAAPFIFMGTVLGRALIAEDRRTFELTRHCVGALLNVALNLVLIPRFGGAGAAIATVLSYAVASYFSCLFYAPARFHLRLMTQAFLWPLRLLRDRHSSPGPGAGTPGSGPRDDGPPWGPPWLPAPDQPPANGEDGDDGDEPPRITVRPRERAEDRRTPV